MVTSVSSRGRRGCLASLMLFAALAGCGRHGAGAPTGGSDVKPSKVKLQRIVDLTEVQQRPIIYHIEMVGLLEAEQQTDIAAGVSGVVDEVLFREGDEVVEGMTLIKIDQTRYETEAEAALFAHERALVQTGLMRDLADRAERSGRGIAEEEKVKARANLLVAEAELRTARAMFSRASHNLQRSHVRAPYAGRINKRMVTKGSYVEEKSTVATIADLSKIRLVGYIPETAAPLARDLLNSQEQRLSVVRKTIQLGGFGPFGTPWPGLAGTYLTMRNYVPSGFDPEFELQAMPNQRLTARLFYMSTVADRDTHMFEAKAEVLGWSPELPAIWQKHIASLPAAQLAAAKLGLGAVSWLSEGGIWNGLAGQLLLNRLNTPRLEVELRPGYTAKIRVPLRSNPRAAVIPEEAGRWEAVRASEHGFIAFVPVMERDEQGRVVKDKDGKPQWVAQRRRLELGFRAPGWVEVRSGLAPGEWVVRRGADTLEEGTPLAIPPHQLERLSKNSAP